MKKVLVLHDSMYGHIERMAESVAEGALTVAGADGSRKPSEMELALAKFQGTHVAKRVSRMQ